MRGPAGGLDETFGQAGLLTVADPVGFALGALAVQSDGRIVYAGGSLGSSAVVVRRILSGGSPDNSFGIMGSATIPFATVGGTSTSVLIQPTGRIVIVGDAQEGKLGIARLLPDGRPDAVFAANGLRVLASSAPLAACMASDGSFFVLTHGPDYSASLMHFSVDGAIDTTFGTNGFLSIDKTLFAGSGGFRGAGIALAADGIYVSGSIYTAVVKAVLLQVPRSGVGAIKRGVAEVGETTQTSVQVVAGRPDKVVVLGFSSRENEATAEHMTLFGFDTAMSKDANFGAGIPPISTLNERVSSMVQDDSSRLLIVGAAYTGVETGKFRVQRRLPVGKLDSAFGTAGAVEIAIGTEALSKIVVIQPDKRILAGGDVAPSSGSGSVVLARFWH